MIRKCLNSREGKNKGFTLVELMISIAILGILVVLASQWFINGPVKASNMTNRIADLQTGVNSSLDMVTNTLQKSSQVHLVGKEIYDDSMDLQHGDKDKLDSNFSYIAFKKIGDQKVLVNIVPAFDASGNLTEWQEVPILATQKEDAFQENYISYNMSFYPNDSKMKDKMEKKILTVSITGQTYNSGGVKQGEPYTASKDITLNNAHQILISKWLKDGIENATAIAYDSGKIKKSVKKTMVPKDVAIVMAVDMSGTMKLLLNGGEIYDRYSSKTNEIRRAIAGRVIQNNLLEKLHNMAVEKNLNISLYMYGFSAYPQPFAITKFQYDNKFGNDTFYFGKDDGQGPASIIPGSLPVLYQSGQSYLYSLSAVTNIIRPIDSKPYAFGPYRLQCTTNDDLGSLKGRSYQDAWDFVINSQYGLNMVPGISNRPHAITSGTGTNIGETIMLGANLLNQLSESSKIKNKNGNQVFDENFNNKFFIILTDGRPQGYTRIENNPPYDVRLGNYAYPFHAEQFFDTPRTIDKMYIGRVKHPYYVDQGSGIEAATEGATNRRSMDYVRNVVNATVNENTYNKAYLIGFSGVPFDLSKQGEILNCLNDRNGTDADGNPKAIRMDATSELELTNVFTEVIKNIEINIDLFEGPRKLR